MGCADVLGISKLKSQGDSCWCWDCTFLNGPEKGTGKGMVCDCPAEKGATQDLTTGPPSQASAPWVTELLSSSAGFFSFLARFSQVTSLGSNWTICFKRKPSSFGFWGVGLMRMCTRKVFCIKFFTMWPYCLLWGVFGCRS